MPTAYANQKTLLLNRLLRTTWAGGTKYVATTGNDSTGAGTALNPYATASKALSTITDATANKRYRIWLADGNYTETAVLDFNAKPYVDLSGSGPRNIGDTAGVKITCSLDDVVKQGGGNNLISGVHLNNQDASQMYAVHGDSAGTGLQILYNCKLTSLAKEAAGIALRAGQRWFLVDSTIQCDGTTNGMTTRPAFGETAGRLAAIGCTFKGPKAGVDVHGDGSLGMSMYLFSGCTFQATGSGGTPGTGTVSSYGDTDFSLGGGGGLVVGTGQKIPQDTGADSDVAWPTGSGTTYTLIGYYNSHEWRVRNYGTAQSGMWTLYYSTQTLNGVPPGWILYRSAVDGWAAAYDPVTFEAGRGATTDYFYLPGEGGWESQSSLPMIGHGTNFAALTPPKMYSGFLTHFYGWSDEPHIFWDNGGGANTCVHAGGNQAVLASFKDICAFNSRRIVQVYNGLLLALSWLDQDTGSDFDPAYPDITKLLYPTDRGDGTPGTLPLNAVLVANGGTLVAGGGGMLMVGD
jgi:hypothetical protein